MLEFCLKEKLPEINIKVFKIETRFKLNYLMNKKQNSENYINKLNNFSLIIQMVEIELTQLKAEITILKSLMSLVTKWITLPHSIYNTSELTVMLSTMLIKTWNTEESSDPSISLVYSALMMTPKSEDAVQKLEKSKNLCSKEEEMSTKWNTNAFTIKKN